MKNAGGFASSVESSYKFHDELLLALERSGKTLVEIQSIILPWNNVKRVDMITIGEMQYPNDEACHSNRIQKIIRVQELLNATFKEKEQSHATFLETKEQFKKATRDKESSDRRYKYLAGVAKKEFNVTKPRKRKLAGELFTSDYLGALHDFRTKQQRLNDFGEDDEEEFPSKEELSKDEEILSDVKLEEPSGHGLERTPIGLLSGNWRASNLKYESQSASSASPDYSYVKREPSEGLTHFQPTTRGSSSRRRSSTVNYMDFRMDMSSPSGSEMSRGENVHELKHQQSIGRGSFGKVVQPETSLQGSRACLTPPSTSQMPKNAKNSTWTGRRTATTTPSLAQTGSQAPADTPRTNSSELSLPKTERIFACKSETSDNDTGVEPSVSNNSNTSHAGIEEAATPTGSIRTSDTEPHEPSTIRSCTSSSESAATMSPEPAAVEVDSTAASAVANDTDVDDLDSDLAGDMQTSGSEGDDELSYLMGLRGRHVSPSDMSDADFDDYLIPSVSTGSYSATGGASAADSDSAAGSDSGSGSDAKAGKGLVEEYIDIPTDEESD